MSVTIPTSSQIFNRGLLDKEDPADGVGTLILPFSFSHIYDDIEEHEKLPKICEELYARVVKKLQSGNLGKDINFRVVEYQDAKQQGKEVPRKYIVITRETNRKTRIIILARFLPYANKLYVSVDSYVLGSLDVWQVAWRVAVTLLPMSCVLISFAGNSISPFGNQISAGEVIGGFVSNVIFCLIPWALITVPFFWLSVLRNFQQEQNILLALRQSYNRIVNSQSFNVDDVLMTLKSVLPLILHSVRDVLKENGISVKTLDAFVESIQTINNIQNVYGSFNAIAGAGGVATANISQSK